MNLRCSLLEDTKYGQEQKMNYTEITNAIKEYTDNTETTFVNNLREFIRATENRIFKSVDFEVFRKNVTSATTSSDRFLSVPDDYLASFSLSITIASALKTCVFVK